jgi:hypothetical protein
VSDDKKPYFLNMRHAWEFPLYKKVIWKLFGKKIVGTDKLGQAIVTAYTLFNITYVSEVRLVDHE